MNILAGLSPAAVNATLAQAQKDMADMKRLLNQLVSIQRQQTQLLETIAKQLPRQCELTLQP